MFALRIQCADYRRGACVHTLALKIARANPHYSTGLRPQAIGIAGLRGTVAVIRGPAISVSSSSVESCRDAILIYPIINYPITRYWLQSPAMPRKATSPAAALSSDVPAPTRPRMPAAYSPKGAKSSFLPWSWVAERLERSHNYWICTTRADGRPHAIPVWGVYVDGAVVFSTDPSSLKARNMKRNPAITVHLESGDEVVILEGTVEVIQINNSIDEAYNAKYKMRLSTFPGPAAVYSLKPKVVLAWREKDFPISGTRWQFD